MQLFKEKGKLDTYLRMLQTKERKSSWYQKRKKKTSLPPLQSSSQSSLMDIRKLWTVKTASSTCTKAVAPDVAISQQTWRTETKRATDENEVLVSSSAEVQVISNSDASCE